MSDRPPGLSLVVTADDFGIGRKTSEGIIRAHREGPVTATSGMAVTGDPIKSSVSLLESVPDLEVGLHLVLTGPGGQPLALRGRASGLTGRDGRFLSNGQMWAKAWTGRLSRAAV